MQLFIQCLEGGHGHRVVHTGNKKKKKKKKKKKIKKIFKKKNFLNIF